MFVLQLRTFSSDHTGLRCHNIVQHHFSHSFSSPLYTQNKIKVERHPILSSALKGCCITVLAQSAAAERQQTPHLNVWNGWKWHELKLPFVATSWTHLVSILSASVTWADGENGPAADLLSVAVSQTRDDAASFISKLTPIILLISHVDNKPL